MTLDEQIKRAFSTLVEQEDRNLRQISLKKGLAYSIIHKLYSGESSFSKMSVQTLAKLFPRLRISFFGEEPNGITVNGNNTGAIASGANARASVQTGAPPVPWAQEPALSDESTRILLSYWRELPPSRRFEFLMKLAEVKEAAKKES